MVVSEPVVDGSDIGDDVYDSPLPTRVTLLDRYCASILRHPLRHLAVYLTIILATNAIVVGLDIFELSELGQYDWAVASGPASTAEDAFLNAITLVDTDENATDTSRSRPQTRGTFQLIYDSVDKNSTIFTAKKLQAICEFEQLIINSDLYRQVCLTTEPKGVNTTCILPQTSLVANLYSQFIPSFDYSECILLDDGLVEASRNTLDSLLGTEEGLSQVGFFVDKGYKERGFAISTRSVIQLGSPLDGYTGETDRATEQDKIYANFVKDFEAKMFKKYNLKSVILSSGYRTDAIGGDPNDVSEQVEFRVFSQFLFDSQLDEQVIGDLVMVVGALSFVSLWMALHTRTIFVTAISMLSILCSLVVAFFFYRFVLGIVYYTELHILTIFLILGVGADNTFVFYDSWQQYKFAKYPARLAESGIYLDLVKNDKSLHGSLDARQFTLARLVVTYRHAASSVFNTSFTTATAFIATAISPIMPVSSFGIYAAICIIVNYFYVLSVIPATVVIHHYYMEGKPFKQALCCCCHKQAGEPDEKRESVSDIESDDVEVAVDPEPSDVLNMSQTAMLDDEANASGSIIERTFEHVYIPLMLYEIPGTKFKPCAWLTVLGCLGYTGVSGYWASQLESPIKFEENFSSDHMFTGFQDDFAVGFLGGTESQFETGTVVWGIEGLDRESAGFNRYIPGDNRGFAVFDDDFELADPRTQELYLEVCDVIGNATCSADGCLGGVLASPGSVVCALKEFQTWVALPENGAVADTLVLGANSPEIFYAKLKEFSDTTKQPNEKDLWDEIIGFVDGKVKFVVVKFTTTLALLQSAGVVVPVEEQFVKIMKDTVSKYINSRPANEPRDSGILKTLENYIYLIGQRTRWNETQFFLVQGMLNGFLICFPVAFVVLLFATMNLPLALFAILAIASIVACVMGFVQHFMGWYLAISEALVAVLIIGFSVDYVVHLGHTYMEAGSPQVGLVTREERFKYAANNMGPTTLAGAITTGGAGAFMFACQLTFFSKMAVLISATIIFSSIFAHGLFMGLCVTIGPEGDSGMINKCCKSKRDK